MAESADIARVVIMPEQRDWMDMRFDRPVAR